MHTFLHQHGKKVLAIFAIMLFLCAPLSFTSSGIEVAQVSAQESDQTLGNIIAGAIKDAAGATLSGIATLGAPIATAIGELMGRTALSVASFVVWFGGMLFDTSMEWFVVEFGSRVREPLFDGALTQSWSIVRDICNLAFIFGFIYIGIRTIIDPDSSSMKRFLSRIIIGALLINFSLYITQVVIDFTNFTAVKVYDAIVPPNTVTDSGAEMTISKAIGNYLGINGLFADVEPDILAQMTAGAGIAYYFAAAAFLWITGLTLAAGGVLLLVRFVELLLIMVFSPVFFAALVFPQTEQYAEKIKDRLLGAAFYAPAYLLLLYLSLAIANALIKPPDATMIQVISGARTGTGPFAVVLNFAIIIFLMVSALKLAKTLSTHGVHFVTSIGSKASAVIGRNTIGRGAGMLSKQYEKLDAKMGTSNNRFVKGLRWTADATNLTKNIQTGLKKAKTGTYGGKTSYLDEDKWQKETDSHRREVHEGLEQKAAIAAAASEIKKHTGATTPAGQQALRDAQGKLQKTVLDASTAQIAELLKKFKEGSDEHTSILRAMSQQQFEKLLDDKNESLDDTEKAALRENQRETLEAKFIADENARRQADAKKNGTTAILVTKIADDPRMLAQATASALETVGFEFVKKYAGVLTAAQMEDLKKNKKFVEAEMKQIEDARQEYFDTILAATNPNRTLNIINEIKSRKAKDVAKLPKNLLTDTAVAPHLTVDMLNAIATDTALDYSLQRTIINNVRAAVKSSTTPDPTIQKYVESSRMVDKFAPV
jgi:hypothetical protein